MSNEILILSLSAASIGFIHTIVGVDHYIPFIAISKASNWSTFKTIVVTVLCGVGHVLSSVIIGAVGIALGYSLFSLESLESLRGDIAAWLLIGFGLLYTIWGIHRSVKKKPHSHFHTHGDEAIHYHSHKHSHSGDHVHVHHEKSKEITPWVLFIIFIFGPCEALIPILMFPAANHSVYGIVLVTTIFGVVTISTMVGMVLLGLMGIRLLPLQKLENHVHALAGLTIFLCGVGIQFLGI